MASLFGKFLAHQAGNVAITFAVAIVPMLLAVGMGVDMVRANSARTTLQGAADAAALAGGSSKANKINELKAVATSYLKANGAADALDKLEVTQITSNTAKGTFKVVLKGKLKTSFMMLAGVPAMDIEAFSEVKRGSSGPLEMVLALDTTYSMIENGKIGTLKAAATDLVNKVMAGGNVKTGVVPFSDYFKVGMKYKGEPWLDVPPDSTWEYCQYNYPNKSGCSIQTNTCYDDGVPYSCQQETCSSWGNAVAHSCQMVTTPWTGCITARPEAYHASIADATIVPYPGRNWGCGTEMLALTTSRNDVLNTIDALSPAGNTHIPSGLIWAWNMLTPEAPLTESMPSAQVKAQGGKKVMVLMTDGANSSSTYDDGNYGPHESTKYGNSTYTDNLTATLCENIKAEGVIVYTVLFDVSDPTIENLLRNCASDPAKSYVADDAAALMAAFGNIGASLTKLRITQ